MRATFLMLIIMLIYSSAMANTNSCPQRLVVAVACNPTDKPFQLLTHTGIYINPKVEFDKKTNSMICSYNCGDWVSKYRYIENAQEKILEVRSLEGLANIVRLIRAAGFNIDHFSNKSLPFSVMTYKMVNSQYSPDQMFLFSGIESTFDNDNFSVAALDKKRISTIVINERYFKTQDAAADTFVTGSNCYISIK